MGRRGRAPERKKDFAVLVQAKAKPPRHLPPAAKKTWRLIVDSLPAGHFRDSELPLLEKYVLADLIYHQAMDQVLQKNEAGKLIPELLINTTKQGYAFPNIYLTVANKQVQLMVALSTKLRIATNARISGKVAGAEGETKPNPRRKGLMFRA